MRNNFQSISSVFCAAWLAFVVGCAPTEHRHRESTEKTSAQVEESATKPTPEPTWTEAAEAVRRGESIEIRLKAAIEDAQLAELKGLTDLRRINLPESQISDAGLAVIAKEVPQLELLRIGSPKITDAGLTTVAQMKKLRFLHLIEVPITDAGLKHLEPMTWLESFYLDGGKATDEGLSALITALPELHFHLDQQHLPGDPNCDKHGQ